MKTFAASLLSDEAGFIVSAEFILISTIVVLGLVPGLSELALNLNTELEDTGSAFASLQQTFHAGGFCGHNGSTVDSNFYDSPDFCDFQNDIN